MMYSNFVAAVPFCVTYNIQHEYFDTSSFIDILAY